MSMYHMHASLPVLPVWCKSSVRYICSLICRFVDSTKLQFQWIFTPWILNAVKRELINVIINVWCSSLGHNIGTSWMLHNAIQFCWILTLWMWNILNWQLDACYWQSSTLRCHSRTCTVVGNLDCHVFFHGHKLLHSHLQPKFCCNKSFNRTQSRAVTGLLTGHNTLRRHLHLMGLSDSPLCRRFGAEDEASAHIVCECEALASLRHVYLGCFFLEPEDIKSISLGAIWNFSKATGLP